MAISFAILEQFRVILNFVFAGQAGQMHGTVICINSTPTQMIDGTEKPIRSLQTRMRYNEFGYKLNKRCFFPSSNFNTLILSHAISSSKDCIKVQEKKEKVVVLCFHPPQKGTFMSQSFSHGKEMYKKALRTCKVLPLLNLFLFRGRHQGFQ